MNIGTRLREERERREITLQQLAKSTKLSMSTLQRIEANEFDRLPEGVYLKGYLRAYAREVGLNGDEVVAEYLQQQSPAIDSVPIAREQEPEVRPQPARKGHPFRNLIFVASAGVVALAAYQGFPNIVTDFMQLAPGNVAALAPALPAPPPPPQMVPRVPEHVASAPAEQGTASTPAQSRGPASPLDPLASAHAQPDVAPTTGSAASGLSLELHPTSDCWVSVVADGEQVVYRTIQSGERVTVSAHDELQLRVGDPSLLAYTVNGVPGRRLGQPGQPVTVRITKDNYQTFGGSAAPAASPESPDRDTTTPERSEPATPPTPPPPPAFER